MAKHKSLSEYALRRYRLAGKAILDEHGNPFFAPTDTLQADIQARGNGHFVSFANYDYLGLGEHPEVRAAAHQAVDRFGVGALASRLVGGERSTHQKFEDDLAGFLGVEATLALVSGYLTNLTVITHLMSKRDAIFLDELSHNSVATGARTSDAAQIVFRHNDLDHLDQLLTEHREKHSNVLIAVESLYSMDGDTIDLPRLVALKKKHQAWLLVDEAHSIGVMGERGTGLCEYCGVDPDDVDIIIGTLSKSFASCGGFVAGKRGLIDWLKFTLPGFVYSVGLSPVITAAAAKALELMQTESWRIGKLAHNAEFLRDTAQAAGLDTGPAIGRAVVPILFNSVWETMAVSQHLLANGIYVPPVVQVGVPKDKPRLRFFISASHTEDEIRQVVQLILDRPVVEPPRALAAALEAPASL
ncbi:MAG: aminotransferase class I/II-fold pyridoxal phosphate-dependent enzyme [Hyphomicrobiales bacterium]|nr:aminotransferase class I/II-fold pyridoxal phosphate-dependent enzyme [Hyphomicrobiales bacterium]